MRRISVINPNMPILPVLQGDAGKFRFVADVVRAWRVLWMVWRCVCRLLTSPALTRGRKDEGEMLVLAQPGRPVPCSQGRGRMSSRGSRGF